MWAGLIARLNQPLGDRAGFLNPLLYETVDPSVFNDVPTGGNGAYRARRNAWDACTGHGSPRGKRADRGFGGLTCVWLTVVVSRARASSMTVGDLHSD